MVKEFKNLMLKKKTSEINRTTLKKIFYLINFVLELNEKIPKEKEVLEKKINEFVNSSILQDKLNKIQENQSKKPIIDIRIRSIIQSANLEEYITKNVKEKYSVYSYSNKTVIYIKNNNLKKEEVALELKNFEYLLFIGKDKKKKIKLADFLKENIDIRDYDKIILKNTTL